MKKAPEKWTQVEELFNAALELEPAARGTFLAEACAGDEELRREVESLLAFETETAGFIRKPALEVAAKALAGDEREADQPKIVLQQIGAYRIIELLGKGGMGEVYLAFDPRLERKVAIKVLPAEFTTDAERVRRFEQEARAASALNHPNIITIHEIGQSGEARYIVQEFVEGETLRQRLARGRMTLTEALEVATQIAAALTAAHEAGIVHRDIKPENVMLRRDGYVKVLDFGLAKLTERRRDRETERQRDGERERRRESVSPSLPLSVSPSLRLSVSTTPGIVMGTASYMSPEQARGLKVDARTDIFSLGVVLYEMVAGRRPFEGATMMDVIAAILDREPAPLNLHAPAELQRIVSLALRKGLEERYQTSGEMLGDLKALRLNLEIAGSEKIPAKRAASGVAPPSGFLKRHRKVATLILAIALAAIAGYFYLNREAAIESIAVLPFKHANAGPESEYLSEGLTEGLINRLSELPRLRVIARRSVYGYKGDTTDPQAVRQALGVQYLLTGKIAGRNDRLEISVELMDVRDNRHVWGGQYQYEPADIAAAQGEIAREVSLKLRPELTRAAQQRLARRAAQNSQAYELYLKGRYFWNKRTPDGIKRALDYFQQAAGEDPNYATAYAGLADAWITASDYIVLPAREAYPKAKDAAVKALALDDTLAEAHTSLAMILASYDWEWRAAEASFRRAIDLNPSYPTAHQWYAEYLAGMGRHAEALAEIRKAQQLDPTSLVFQSVGAWVLYYARDYDRMIAQCQRALDLDPNFGDAYIYLMRAYEQKGMYREAMDAYQKGATLKGWSSPEGEAIRRAPVSGYADYWRKRVELERLSEDIAPFNLAEALAQLDEKPEERDRAFALLDRCFAERDYHLMYLKTHPNLDRLRSDARFHDLLRRIGLPVEENGAAARP